MSLERDVAGPRFPLRPWEEPEDEGGEGEGDRPDGSRPGETKDLTGTYDPQTGAFTIEWSSQIVGGSFNGFTGVWHLEGTFEKA